MLASKTACRNTQSTEASVVTEFQTETKYAYDAENHLVSTAGVNYTYDGDGKRVMKSNGVIYWYGLNPAPLMETDFSGDVEYDYMYLNGERLARRNNNNEIDWYINDALGSTRQIWDMGVVYGSDYYPFGGERAISGTPGDCRFGCSTVTTNYKFTGKERDFESGLDNFGARYFTSTYGRFMTPDWAAKPTAVPYANFGNPQSLNLYSYVKNNPTTFGDPDGHQSLTTDVSVAMDAWLWNHMTERQRQFTKGAATLISLPFGGEGLLAEAGEAAEAGSALKSTIVAVKAIGLTSAGVMGSMQVTGAAMNFSTAPAEPVMNFISLPPDGLTSLSVLKNPNSVVSDPIGTIQAGQNVVNTGGNLLDTLINIALSHILPTIAPPTLPAQFLPPSPTGPTVTTCSASAETQNNAPQKTCTVYDPAGGGA